MIAIEDRKTRRTKLNKKKNKKNQKTQNYRCNQQSPKKAKVSGPAEQRKKISPVKAVIIASVCFLPFLIFGAAMIKMGISEISHRKACSAEVKGIIVTDVSVQKVRSRTGKGTRYTRYDYSANYTFEYNGEAFTDRITTTHKIKKGQEIKVRCDPDDPEDHYVKNLGDSVMMVFIIIFGVFWDAIWVFLIFCIWRCQLRHSH